MNEPRIDVTISFKALRVWGTLAILLALLILMFIGVLASPIVAGHPVVLTRERLAIKHYLETACDWAERLERIAQRFDALGPMPASTLPVSDPPITGATVLTITLPSTSTTQITLPVETPLASPYRPASQATNLYDRAQQTEQTIADLQALDAERQQIETPPALSGLHTLASDALQAYARWSAALLDHIGAPSADSINAFQAARDEALSALAAFKDALQAQGDRAP
jgi:hypothetical protein